jgi:hypothetical protein
MATSFDPKLGSSSDHDTRTLKHTQKLMHNLEISNWHCYFTLYVVFTHRAYSDLGVNPATNLSLELKLGMSGFTPLLPPYDCIACTGTT